MEKNKIKEIERILATSGKYITYAERCYVLDYITNLQDTLQDREEYIGHLEELCDKYEEEHSTTFEYWKQLVKEDYKSTNEKANEFIKEHTNNFAEYLDVYEAKELLDILNGDDNE